MPLNVNTTAWHEAEADWLIVPIDESRQLDGRLGDLDQKLGGTLARLSESGDLTGKLAELLPVPDAGGIAAQRLLVVGLGKADELTRQRFEKAAMAAVRSVSSKEDVSAAFAVPEAAVDDLSTEHIAETIAISLTVGGVGQDSLKAERGHHPLASGTLLVDDSAMSVAEDAAARGAILGDAMNLTRELVNLPPQQIYPESVADRAQAVASDLGLNCTVLGQQELEDEKMGSMLAVAQGSDRPPRLVSVEYRAAGDDAPTLAIVGKGVTFDSGGLSLKPSDSMIAMKSDMAGSATALGAIAAIARLKLPVNVTAYLGLVENMVSGSSYKLGDILTARNGVTIEVQNTDAEGRLVLADVLHYAAERGADRIIDLATLTGACVVALGEDVTGAFSNDQDWCNQVLAAASTAGEYVWQLPTFDFYSELLKSDVADCRNIGGRWGGAITAAKFLEKFVDKKPWVHLDIAGPSFASSNKPHREGGATGCMVRTLVEAAAALS
ncbi:MAG: leucyl aminopeptidase [Planctomycetota bacterium]|jgi:leucyl aminopeptidase